MAEQLRSFFEKSKWRDMGYHVPLYDRDEVKSKTKENPYWVHFGYGNIFRAFQANVVQRLLNEGELDRGLVAVSGIDSESIRELFWPRDNYSVLVTLKADGTAEKTIIGSVVESMTADRSYPQDISRLKEIFCKDSLQMVSFTITEKGYSLVDAKGEYLDAVKADFENGPDQTKNYLGTVVSLLLHRYQSGAKPLAMVSMDNCSHNGDRLRAVVCQYALEWAKRGFVDEGFVEYVKDPDKISYPWTMIDKITPRSDPAIEEMLVKDMGEEIRGVTASNGRYLTPYVNAEECEYLVIEDWFPAGRPALEQGGVIFTDRDTVDKVEKMKVCTCLNPLHTTLAIFGCLLGYTKISEEMKNPLLKKLVDKVGHTEGLPVVTDPGIINPKEFIDTVLNVRIPNPFMPDTPQRIAMDTSQKLSVRFGETIKAYQKSENLSIEDLQYIPLVFAGWLRYLMGIDDAGVTFELSTDPLLEELQIYLVDLKLGGSVDEGKLRPLLENEQIFGVNLYEVGMAGKVIGYLEEMTAGPGAVQAVLEKYL